MLKDKSKNIILTMPQNLVGMEYIFYSKQGQYCILLNDGTVIMINALGDVWGKG